MESLLNNLASPVLLAFALGMVGAFLKSDLRLPEPVYAALSIYLLLAIGFKGGVAVSETPAQVLLLPALATLLLGIITPLVAYFCFRKLVRLPLVDAAALAAHYGSVSAVTFVAAVTLVGNSGYPSEGFLPALVAILEVPGIIVGLFLFRLQGDPREASASWAGAFHEVVTGKSIVLLMGGLIIGAIAGPDRMAPVTPLFNDLFMGALVLFMIQLGMLAAVRITELRSVGVIFVLMTFLVPLVNGALGVAAGLLAGLDIGGAAVLGAMTSSASYIAAPAAVRLALPDANPALYLTASLGLTFPFNLTIGIPVYLEFAKFFQGVML